MLLFLVYIHVQPQINLVLNSMPAPAWLCTRRSGDYLAMLGSSFVQQSIAVVALQVFLHDLYAVSAVDKKGKSCTDSMSCCPILL